MNQPARLTPPSLDGRVPRPRLLQRLDTLLAAPPAVAVWIGAAPGSGKSTLAAAFARRAGRAAHWLRLDASDNDPAWLAAQLQAVAGPAGARVWPRLSAEAWAQTPRAIARVAAELWAALPDDALLVIDDLEVLDDARQLALWTAAWIEHARRGQRLLLLSRRPPPPELLAAQAEGRLKRLPATELRLVADEMPDAPALAQGWPMAAALLRQDDGPQQLGEWLAQVLWPALQPAERQLLEDAAWWPALGAAEVGEAGLQLLAGLAAQGLLVDRLDTPGPCFRMHGLLQQHLRAQQRSQIPGGELAARLARQAEALAGRGDPTGALALWAEVAALDAGALGPLGGWLVEQAPQWLAAGRHQGLRAAVALVPPAQRSAELWWALAQAEAPVAPARARDAADRAIALCAPGQQALAARGHMLAIATQFQAFDDTRPLAARMAALQALEPAAGHPEQLPPGQGALAVAMFSALFLRQPGHAQLAAWRRRVQQLLVEDTDPNVKLRAGMLLAKEAWYTGRHAELLPLPLLNRQAATQPGVGPYGRLLLGLQQQYAAWALGDWPGGLTTTRQALADADETGIALLDRHLRLHGACFARLGGDVAQAQRWMDEVQALADPSRPMETWHHFSVRAWLALLDDDAAAADAAAQVAVQAAQAMGAAPEAMTRALRCHALQALGDLEALAAEHEALKRAADGVAVGHPLAGLHLHLIDSRTLQLSGDVQGALVHLAQGLALARRHGLWAPFGVAPRALAELLALALRADLDRPGAVRLVQQLGLAPPQQADVHWPWAVRLDCTAERDILGIECQGRPLSFAGKLPRKPLALLQAVVHAGGSRDVSFVVDQLWPGLEGDRAEAAFEVALRRLRALLGCADALVLSGGRLSLNPRRVLVATPLARAARPALSADAHTGTPAARGVPATPS